MSRPWTPSEVAGANSQACSDVASWTERLAKVAAYLGVRERVAPSQKTADQEERTLGVWLHTQGIDYRAEKLTAAKEAQLKDAIPL